MSTSPALVATLILMHGVLFAGLGALRRKRFDSACVHLGCACIMAGWLIGQHALRHAASGHPLSGAMALMDGDTSDELWDGTSMTNFVGRVPFTVHLERFIIERYPATLRDREEGREGPVREYRSRVTITEPDQAPQVYNIRVNQPAYIRGYHIYQMSWGESKDRYGRPASYTVLQFIRDPGWPIVCTGFVILFLGVTGFTVRLFRSDPGRRSGRGN